MKKKVTNGLKESFIAATLLTACGVICLVQPDKTAFPLGAGLLVFGLIFYLIFTVLALNVFSEIEEMSKKMDEMSKKMDAQLEVLNDINRHICEGFNGIAEYLSNK